MSFRTLVSLFCLLILATSTGLAAQGRNRRTSTEPIDLPGGSRVEFHQLESAAIGGPGQFSIFFPPSYQKSSESYPVVYFLHGMFNDHTSWTMTEYGNPPALLDQWMIEKKLPEMVIVHPNGGRSFYTNYFDGSEKWEDFVVTELPAHIEKAYRIKTGRGHRAIAGTSMGGYGALKIAMRHPELYRAVAAHSPIVFPMRNPLDVAPEARSGRGFEYFTSVFAAVYGSPLDQDYYDANNPLLLAESARLDGLAIYFDYGTADRYERLVHLGEGLAKLDRTLTERGVPHVFRVHQGEPHGWALVIAHLEESLRFIAEKLDD